MLCYVIWLFVKRLSQEAIQRRSQRDRLVKIKVFKLRRDADDIPCNITLRSAGGESFHSAGPTTAKARFWDREVRDQGTVAVLGFFVWGANGAGIFCLGGLMAIAEGKKRLPKKISDLCISPKNFIYLQKISDDLFFFFSHRLFLCFNLLFVSVTSRTKFWGGG